MRVSDLVGEGHECAVRVLLPVRGAAGQWHFWKDVVDSVEIDGEVYWEQICDRAPKLMDAPYGDLSDQTAAMLVDALAQGRDGECYFALWKGYGEDSPMTRVAATGRARKVVRLRMYRTVTFALARLCRFSARF